jgi:2-polyprenyl-3-methyl-5-hydroxy-6-metoxy-1,4-benzoquinol methylase
MNLFDIVNRKSPSAQGVEYKGIPYQNTEFSSRLLKEYLFQTPDSTAPDLDILEKHVGWIHQEVLKGRISKILDLCCGPGMYSTLLAKKGHRCKGIDFSPAYIEYAHITKIELLLDCEYSLADIVNIDYGREFDFALFLNGEMNLKSYDELSKIMKNLNASLKEGGFALIELIPFEKIEHFGHNKPTWKSQHEGVFSEKPHLLLNDFEWVEDKNHAIARTYIVMSDTSQVAEYSTSYYAYSVRDYEDLFSRNGFTIANKYTQYTHNQSRSGMPLFGILIKKVS